MSSSDSDGVRRDIAPADTLIAQESDSDSEAFYPDVEKDGWWSRYMEDF